MARKKKTVEDNQGSGMRQGKKPSASPVEPKSKVEQLVEMICDCADSEGYFDPKDVQARIKNTDLGKSASIIMSNLRLQGFRKGDLLRAPVSDGPQAVKKLINLASSLRKNKTFIPYEEAVAGFSSKPLLEAAPAEPTAELEPKPEPIAEVQPKPAGKTQPKSAPKPRTQPMRASEPKAPQAALETLAPAVAPPAEPEKNFRALYEAMYEKALKLEAELGAYKNVCDRLIEAQKK